ncbi:prepilin-type N-terminal cleavage/methylation domain-containing protein [Candidatus Omnitrophota bacterium]
MDKLLIFKRIRQVFKDVNNRAFTLTEILVSVLIIAILAAGMLGSFVGAQYFFNRSRHRLQALHFIREAHGRLRSNYTYTDSQMNAGSHTEAEIAGIVKGELTSLNHQLTYDINSGSMIPPMEGYKEIALSITWDETSF